MVTALSISVFQQLQIEKNLVAMQMDHARNLLNMAQLHIETQYKSYLFHRSALETERKQFLKSIVSIAISEIENNYKACLDGKISEQQAKENSLNFIRKVRYSDGTGYLWVNNTETPHPLLIAHPFMPELEGTRMDSDDPLLNRARGKNMNLFQAFVEACVESGEGYVDYLWPKPAPDGKNEIKSKLSFVKEFKPWKWIVGSGLYFDDLERDSMARIEAIKDELAKAFARVKISENSYLFLFDGKYNVLIHPDYAGKTLKTLANPDKEKVIMDNLMKIGKENGNTLDYQWKKPNEIETGNSFNKRAFVHYFAPLDWYVVASIYLDELHEPLVNLRWKIILIIAILLSLALLLASALSKSLCNPINELARTAQKIESEGIFYPDVPSSGIIETRKLANCLNSMLLSLKNASDERDMIFRAIQTEEEKHRIILNSLAEAVVSTGITGKIQSMNPAAETLTGVIQAEAVGHTVDEICSFFETEGSDERKPMNLPCQGKEVEAPLQKDAVLLTRTGQEFQVSIKRSPIHDEDGELKGAVLVFRNTTEELQNLQRLNESEWKFNALVNHGPLGVAFHKMIYDENGAPCDYFYIDVNPPFVEMTGVDPCGKTVREAFPGIEKDPYNWIGVFGEVAKTGKTIRFQQILELTGHYYQGLAFQYKPDHFVAAFIDVTEQRNLEEQLRQAQKMDAVGQLAGGIAHDFNNVLGGIRGAAELIELQKSKDATIEKFTRVILQATDRASELISKLMAFSRRSSPLSTPVDSHQAVNAALDILKCSIDKKVTISASLRAEKSIIIGDISLLQNVFINLGINASHAMPDGGTLSIESSCVELDSASCQAYQLEPGQYIKFDVRDTGCGISPEIMPRIFEPFFTTKKTGAGTGLGLAASFGIIKQHRGAIFAYSEVGVGTVFHILLPISEQFKPISERAERPAQGQGVILLIDDEEIILSTVSAILKELGYEVITAGNGEEGIKIFSAEKEKIDLVIVDMIMPKMNGKECYMKLRQICPDVRIILASGFSKEEDLTEMKENGLCGFLQKPYGTNELSQLIKKNIRQRPADLPNS